MIYVTTRAYRALTFADRLHALRVSATDRILLNSAHECAASAQIDMGFSQLAALDVTHGITIPALHTQGMLNITLERIVTALEGGAQ